ncbi:MAG: AGE family epimerase/isomerase, partial [Cyclobacteriaceae bacterium]|nr:AGE family epimerase/isomerase [Cyclobacteriaceae bacterium]
MTKQDIDLYISIYKDGLLQNIIPFWLRHCIDTKHGGFMFAVVQDGTVVDTDKGVWQHGRFTWMLATLYNEVEKK